MLRFLDKNSRAMTRLTQHPFGRLPDGTAVDLFTLTNAHGIEVRVMTYGCVILSLKTPDRHGDFDDIVLGFDDLTSYLTRSRFFGCVVGRYANRIAGGRFTLDGVTYALATNNGPNHLHGGSRGWDKAVWTPAPFERADASGVVLRYLSADGEESYPGEVSAVVSYTLNDRNELAVRYEATTSKPTIINLTQHTYFNLSYSQTSQITGHALQIFADRFTPVDQALIPTGEITSVAGTPLDFQTLTTIGSRIDDPHEQLVRGRVTTITSCCRVPPTGSCRRRTWKTC